MALLLDALALSAFISFVIWRCARTVPTECEFCHCLPDDCVCALMLELETPTYLRKKDGK